MPTAVHVRLRMRYLLHKPRNSDTSKSVVALISMKAFASKSNQKKKSNPLGKVSRLRHAHNQTKTVDQEHLPANVLLPVLTEPQLLFERIEL